MSNSVAPIKAINIAPKRHITPVRMDEEMNAKITKYMSDHDVKTKSRAIRELILKGLG